MHMSGPNSATRGGPRAKLKTRVLPRLAATPVCALTRPVKKIHGLAGASGVRQHNIKVVQERHEGFTPTESRTGPLQTIMLAQREQCASGSLFAPLSFRYAVTGAVRIPPTVLRGLAIEQAHERHERWRDVL